MAFFICTIPTTNAVTMSEQDCAAYARTALEREITAGGVFNNFQAIEIYSFYFWACLASEGEILPPVIIQG